MDNFIRVYDSFFFFVIYETMCIFVYHRASRLDQFLSILSFPSSCLFPLNLYKSIDENCEARVKYSKLILGDIIRQFDWTIKRVIYDLLSLAAARQSDQ